MRSLRERMAALPVATALRETLAEGYRRRDLMADLIAGVTVGLVALPLAMALAIAAGVPPQHGLYTAMLAAPLIALLGGSRGSISGPTAAFIVVLHPVVQQHGLGGLLLATVMAGLILIAMGVARLGRMISYIPSPVTSGFTAGIAVVIVLLQLEYFFGLRLQATGIHVLERLLLVLQGLPQTHLPDLAVALASLAVMIYWPRLSSRLPSHLAAILVGTLLAWVGARLAPGFAVATVGSEFGSLVDGVFQAGIPRQLPAFGWPWVWGGANGEPLALDLATVQALLGPAFAIAMLAAIESLLCAVVVDGFMRRKHDPNAELIAQGVGNVVTPFFGGITASGAINRSTTNLRAGGRSPIAAVVAGLVIVLAVALFAGVLDQVPMGTLTAIMLMTAWNMSNVRHLSTVLRVGPRSDAAVLLCCLGLTVAFDMVVAVVAGVVLAALLFMRQMAAFSGGHWLGRQGAPELQRQLPADTRFYEISGPLFFGAADKAIATLSRYDPEARTVILWLGEVPMIDVTGMLALDSALQRLQEKGVFIVLAGLPREPRRLLRKAGFGADRERLVFTPSIDGAVRLAEQRARRRAEAARTGS